MKKILSILLLFCGAFNSFADYPVLPDTVTASDAFVKLPLETLDLLSTSTRMDMLDFFAADSVYKAVNSMQGESFLKKVRPDYLEVSLTPVSVMSISMLPYRKGEIVMTAYTIGDNDEAFDTDIEFFDGDYKKLPRDRFIRLPELDDFFSYPDKKARERVEELIPFPTVKYVSDPDSLTLIATLTCDQIMSPEDMASIKKFMKSRLVYKWNGRKFVLQKK